MGDAFSLARTIENATANPRLWRSMRDGIREPYSMGTHITRLLDLYEGVGDRGREVALNG